MIGWIRRLLGRREGTVQQVRGNLGEIAAARHLEKAGLRTLVTNYRAPRAEIDLVMRDGDCLAFIEVKTRTAGGWLRPAAAVNRDKRRRLTRAALHYLRGIGNPRVKIRFDIVEVLLVDECVREIRHLPDAFPMEGNRFYPG